MTLFGYTLGDVRKAVVAFFAPVVPLVYQAVQDTGTGGAAITTQEWVLIVGAALGTSALVYGVPNAGTYLPRASTPEEKRAAIERLRAQIEAMPR